MEAPAWQEATAPSTGSLPFTPLSANLVPFAAGPEPAFCGAERRGVEDGQARDMGTGKGRWKTQLEAWKGDGAGGRGWGLHTFQGAERPWAAPGFLWS